MDPVGDDSMYDRAFNPTPYFNGLYFAHLSNMVKMFYIQGPFTPKKKDSKGVVCNVPNDESKFSLVSEKSNAINLFSCTLSSRE